MIIPLMISNKLLSPSEDKKLKSKFTPISAMLKDNNDVCANFIPSFAFSLTFNKLFTSMPKTIAQDTAPMTETFDIANATIPIAKAINKPYILLFKDQTLWQIFYLYL